MADGFWWSLRGVRAGRVGCSPTLGRGRAGRSGSESIISVGGLSGVRSGRAFSLIELVIVVVIMGVIAAIAVPRLVGFERRAEVNSMLASFRGMERAMSLYYDEHRAWPTNTNPGEYPAWMKGYIDERAWGSVMAPGTAWDWNDTAASPAGVGPNVAIACAGTPPIESWRAFELSVDDGKATTGRVRIGKVGGRWALMWQMETSAGVLDAGAEAVVDAVGK